MISIFNFFFEFRTTMMYVTLVKLRRKATKDDTAKLEQGMAKWIPKGNRILQSLYTLGSYDMVWVWESADDKTAMQSIMDVPEVASTETMPAVKYDEVKGWVTQ